MTLKRRKPLKRTPLKPGSPLAKRGKRARRLAPGDAARVEATREHACFCGCGAEGKEVYGAHLLPRGYEATRQEEWNVVPLCSAANLWLDHDAEGVQAKATLLDMARVAGRRLTEAEVRPVLISYGYREWRRRRG